jgi:hypothetical protein
MNDFDDDNDETNTSQDDYQLLAEKVLLQAMLDFVRLQHPAHRDRRYLLEAFMDAADMFYDPDYVVGEFVDDDGNPVGLEGFLKIATDRDRTNISGLHKYLRRSSLEHWKPEEKEILVKIPSIFTVKSIPWYTEHHENDTHEIDFDERIVYINKKTAIGQQQFVEAILDILWDILEVKIPGKARKEFSCLLYETLVINDNLK